MGTDKKIHIVKDGADTALNFSKGVTIEQLEVFSLAWTVENSPYPYGAKQASYTAPSDGVLVINTNIELGVGREYQSNGYFKRYVKNGSTVLINDTVNVNNTSLPFIPAGTKYNIKKNDSLIIRGLFTGTCWNATSNTVSGVDQGGIIQLGLNTLFTFIQSPS